jgi:hypothetical protein
MKNRLLFGLIVFLIFVGCDTGTGPNTETYPATLNVLNKPANLQYVAVFPNDTALTMDALISAATRRPYYPNYDAGQGSSISETSIQLISEGQRANIENGTYVVIAITDTSIFSGKFQQNIQFVEGIGTIDYNSMINIRDLGVYGDVGVWLISQSNFTVYDPTSGKQPTPTAIGFISALAATFNVTFYTPYNFGTSENPGWAAAYPNVQWTHDGTQYYVLLIPMWWPSGTINDGDFYWLFDEGKISGSGTSTSKISIDANPKSFSLTNFISISDATL